MDLIRWNKHQRSPRNRRLYQGCAAVEGSGGLVREQEKPEGKRDWKRAEDWGREDFIDLPTSGDVGRGHFRTLRIKWPATVLLLLATVAVHAHVVEAHASDCAVRHPMGDGWLTGPMLANTAATPPRGHFFVAPYLFDVSTQGTFDDHGTRHSTAHASSYGVQTYLAFGLTDKWALGLIPTFSYNTADGGPSSAGPGVGDLTLQVQRKLTQFVPCRWVPTISAAVQETLPTGRYDRLGSRPADGMGAGAYTTNLEFLSQTYVWMPKRRIARMRLNVADAVSSEVAAHGVSVYHTTAGFSGHVKPGSSLFVDAAWEYSMTRRWALALDATYSNARNTRVTGSDSGSKNGMISIVMDSGVSTAYGLAPAFEYSWKPTIGVLIGVQLIPAGRNTNKTITPGIEINFAR